MSNTITADHFLRAAVDIGTHGDNDTLPFDIDTRFVGQQSEKLANIASELFEELQKDSEANNRNKIAALVVFNERLLAPAGQAGFRVVTKIHPFWNIYLNGLGIGIAQALEERRDRRACSYRFLSKGGTDLFDRNSSWREFRLLTAREAKHTEPSTVVVQTDISGFYDHISHHHIENFIDDLFPDGKVGNQVDALLGKFSGGRSFGLPVGGQCSRVLAELFVNQVDHLMTAKGARWYRFVDDYVLIADTQSSAYQALSGLSHLLADYGLSLSKNKTMFMSSKNYTDYVAAQLGEHDEEAAKLRQIELHFDPYSDTAREDYASLKQTIEGLEVQKLLNRELEKALPDSFLVTQIGRTLQLHEPRVALELCTTLLTQRNLHAFRASWSTIMRGVAHLRSSDDYREIFDLVDQLLDQIPEHSQHLLSAEASLLHYLRTLRFRANNARKIFVQRVYDITQSDTVRRACIDCWRHWHDRAQFTFLRNRWNVLSSECQRLVWLASSSFGDQGWGFRRQVEPNLQHAWRLGIERNSRPTYTSIYKEWCDAPGASI